MHALVTLLECASRAPLAGIVDQDRELVTLGCPADRITDIRALVVDEPSHTGLAERGVKAVDAPGNAG